MTRKINKPPGIRSRIEGFDIRLVWQLIIAFTLVILLVGAGIALAGRAAFGRLESFVRDHPLPMTRLWTDRLTSYYERQGSWEGIETMIASYPCGADWGPWDQGWHMSYVLATADGAIVASSGSERLGHILLPPEMTLSTPVVIGDHLAGRLLLSPLYYLGEEGASAVAGRAWHFFLRTILVISVGSLVVGLVFSRGISRPLVDLTEATRAVAAGDLSVRVPVRHRGEVRELAAAFNTMAEELARADELRRNMTADVAHELRTPLSVIRGKLEGVLDGVYPATPEHLEPILEETEVLTHLVEDLRLLALAEAGQLALEKRVMDMGDLLRDAQVNFGPQASDRGVTLALDFPAELPQVLADWRRVAQVLGNLLTNALRHTPEGGCVTLSATVVPPLVGGTGGGTVAPPLVGRAGGRAVAPPRVGGAGGGWSR
jgi:signal transduction histidine kinase